MRAHITSFASALCATGVLFLLPGNLRAEGDPPKTVDGWTARVPDFEGSSEHEVGAFDCCASDTTSRFETSAALLFLQPSSSNLVYATVVNPFPFLTPHWSDRALDPDFSPSFNVGLRYF